MVQGKFTTIKVSTFKISHICYAYEILTTEFLIVVIKIPVHHQCIYCTAMLK